MIIAAGAYKTGYKDCKIQYKIDEKQVIYEKD